MNITVLDLILLGDKIIEFIKNNEGIDRSDILGHFDEPSDWLLEVLDTLEDVESINCISKKYYFVKD